MSKHNWVFALALLGSCVIGEWHNGDVRADEARFSTHTDAEGKSWFSLSVETTQQAQDKGQQVVILFDTSASQMGLYREDGLSAVKSFATGLENASLFVAALDIKAKSMSTEFASGSSDSFKSAMTKLSQRTPLGATDLISGIDFATKQFDASDSASKHILYVGDGITNAGLNDADVLRNLVGKLIEKQVSFSSYAIGPKQELQLLAALSNHTGGMLYVDAKEITGQSAGVELAKSVTKPIFWPTEAKFDTQPEEVYPFAFPPIRSDRDSVVFGAFEANAPKSLTVTGTIAGKTKTLNFPLEATVAGEGEAIPQIVRLAQVDQGLTLPTLGTPGLTQVRKMVLSSSRTLSKLSSQALATGNTVGAKNLAEEALRQDPGNVEALSVRKSLEKKSLQEAPKRNLQTKKISKKRAPIRVAQAPGDDGGLGDLLDDGDLLGDDMPLDEVDGLDFADDEPLDLESDDEPLDDGLGPVEAEPLDQPAPEGEAPIELIPSDPVPVPAGDGAVVPNEPSFLDQYLDSPEGRAIGEFEYEARLRANILKADVDQALIDARSTMRSDPEGATLDLKRVRENVQRSVDLDEDIREQLLSKLEGGLRQANQRQVEKNETDRLLRNNLAVADSRLQVIEETRSRDNTVRNLLGTFNSLMDERRYEEAVTAAAEIGNIRPRDPRIDVLAEAADAKANLLANYERIMDVRRRRHQMYLAALYDVETSLMPFPDNNPIVYPPAQEWEDLTNRRQKYKSVDLAETGGAEEEIFRQLDSDTQLDFLESPLSEVVEFLEEYHDIEIVIDNRALQDAGLDSNTPITQTLRGISLRSALRLILRELDLTYMVRDEVLQITSLDEAEQDLVTKVYPVADLVLPIQSAGGMNPMMMGGGMGGGMMGGGMGGMGGGMMGGMGGGMMGGMGGGMGGMGMGGGMFAVEDAIQLGTKKPKAVEATKARVRKTKKSSKFATVSVDPKEGQSVEEAWFELFSTKKVDARTVRNTVRELMNTRNFDSVVGLIHASLRSNNAQPWMYQALGLALQAKEAPKDELERALMSAVDLASTPDEMLIVAAYLTKAGLDEPALKLFRNLAPQDPTSPEVYLMGLRAAKRLKDVDGIEWACANILGQAWTSKQVHVPTEAYRVAKATLENLKKTDDARASQFEKTLQQALARDCVVRVTWTGDADVDILIEEPSGSVCSLRNPRSTSGGVILGDSASNSAKNPSADGITETYVLTKGFNGEYRLLMQRVWGQVATGKVTVDIVTNMFTDNVRHVRKQIPLANKDALVVFELNNGRRVEHLAQHQVANAARDQFKMNHAVLAQMVDANADANAIQELASDRGYQLAAASRVNPNIRRQLIAQQLGRRGQVGFQPVLTTLP